MSKVGSRMRIRYMLSLVLLIVLIAGCLTGCGSKKTYIGYFKDMLSRSEGTWKTFWVFDEGGQETKVTATKVVCSDGNASMELQVDLSESDTVTINAVLFDGVWYFDLSALRTSLLSCKSAELLMFAEKVPNNIAYITFSEADIMLKDYFAEESETKAGINGVFNLLDRVDLVLNMFLGAVNQKGGFQFDVTDDHYTLSSTADCDSILLQMLTDIGSYYDKYSSNLSALNLASEYEASEGLKAEKDNFLASLQDIQLKYATMDSSALNSSIKGDISVFESKQSGVEYDGFLYITWNSDASIESAIKCDFSYRPSTSQISKPSSTEIDIAKFNSDYFEIDVLFDTILREGNVLGGWYLDTSLELSDEALSSELEALSKEYLGISTSDVSVADYIAENINSASVLELMGILDSVTGGFKVEVEKPVEEVEVSRFNELHGVLLNGVEYFISVNEAESDSSILVVDVRLLNASDSSVDFETKNFKLRDMGTSIVSANIETQLLEINPEFNVESYSKGISLESGCFVDTKLFFVIPETLGYQDLYLNDELIGNLISF